MTKIIESLASEISKLKMEQHSRKGRAPNAFTFRNLNPYRRTNEQLQVPQRNKDANEDQRMKTPLQNAVMDEDRYEEDDEIHFLEDKGSVSFLPWLHMKSHYSRTKTTKSGMVGLFYKLITNSDTI